MGQVSLGFPGSSLVKNLSATEELQETRVWFLGREDPLEEGMATHSSIFVWRIPWIEEPGGLQSIGSQRIGHDWSDLACKHRLPWWLGGKESLSNAGDIRDTSSIPGSGRSPGGGHDNPPQYSCLENPMDRGAWWATVHRVSQNWSDQHFHFTVMNIKWYWH